jgi:small-conductance mechanosensitive channel
MTDLLQQIVLLPIGLKIVCASLGILLIHAVFRLLESTLPRHFRERDSRYRVRKAIIFVGYAVVILFVTALFEDHLGRVTFALGVAGAGVVVALQDVIASFAGWFAIEFSSLYTVGQRIQIGETKGDVLDISMLRTTLMEIGNWVSGDLYSGRIVQIPNSIVLKGQVFNYSQGFRFVWDEIKVPLTTNSDLQFAREMLLRTANDVLADYLEEAESSWKSVADIYRLEKSSLDPTVTLVVDSGCLVFTLSYIVDYANRNLTKDRLFTRIAQEITGSDGRLIWAATFNRASPKTETKTEISNGSASDAYRILQR